MWFQIPAGFSQGFLFFQEILHFSEECLPGVVQRISFSILNNLFQRILKGQLNAGSSLYGQKPGNGKNNRTSRGNCTDENWEMENITVHREEIVRTKTRKWEK